jgi:hypothetical protein
LKESVTVSNLQAAEQAEARRKEQEERAAARRAKEEAAGAASSSGTTAVDSSASTDAVKDGTEEKDEKKGDDVDDDDDEGKGAKPINNGGTTDRYIWSQTLSDLQVVIASESLGVPSGQLKAKMLTIDIKKNHLKVAVKGKDALIDGELHQAVKTDNCFWTVGAVHHAVCVFKL